jgi:hypothetical protein
MFGKKTKLLLEKYEGLQKQNKTLTTTSQVLMEEIQSYHINDRNKRNPYNTRKAMITEIGKKFHGIADCGNIIAQRVINLRVAFSVPNRLFLMQNPNFKGSDEEVKKCKEYLNSFMEFNGLDTNLPKDLAKEGELEGQVLVKYVWDSKRKVAEIEYYPWSEIGYITKTEPGNTVKLANRRRKITGSVEGKEFTMDSDGYNSFIAFNDKLFKDIGYPTLGPILKTIENIEADMWAWRNLNHLFAHPTPHFKCENKESADAINNLLQTLGWKIGNAIATSSDFTLVGPTGQEATMLMNAVTTSAKIISAHTGIGIHFLGFANVMSNRATADSMGEPTEIVLHAEISSWRAFYKDMFKKVIRMRNTKLNGNLSEDAVIPVLVPLTDRQWQVVREIYGPLAEKGLISKDTLWSRIPDVDPDAEREKLEEQEKKSAEKNKAAGENTNEDNDNSDAEEEEEDKGDINEA